MWHRTAARGRHPAAWQKYKRNPVALSPAGILVLPPSRLVRERRAYFQVLESEPLPARTLLDVTLSPISKVGSEPEQSSSLGVL